MNRNLERALLSATKVRSLMYAYENTYIDRPEDEELKDFADAMFFAIGDAVRELSENLEAVSGDQAVVDAMEAIRRSTLTKKD